MNKKYSIAIKVSIFLVLMSMVFGAIPASRAQSVQTWSDAINLSLSGAASNPSMLVDGDGVIHVFWVDKFEGYKYVESSDGGVTWSTPVVIKFPFSNKTQIRLFTDSKGLVYIFWLTDKNELSFAQTSANNIDTPSAWQNTTKLDASVFDFDAVVDAQGNLYLGYVTNPAPAPGTAGVYYRRRPAGTSAWSGTQLLYESPYFRSLTVDQAHIRLAVSDQPDDKRVFMVWDDRPQKRIFLTHSSDAGATWQPPAEVVNPLPNLGFKTPYQADVNVLDGKLQMTWQVGDPGIRCTPYSSTSSDDGATWDEPVTILAESSQCPERGEFISIEPKYAVELFTVQGDLSISAWNGSQWSDPEIQSGPSSITNPATFDTVLLGCKQASVFQDKLYVVGCDQNPSGDVWFVARQLDPLENLFPMPSAWSGDATVTSGSQKITSLTSIVDADGHVHAFWIQSTEKADHSIDPRIEYARWGDGKWTQPAPVFSDLNGPPLNLAAAIDSQRRLLVTWVNQNTGDLLFAWANAERANISVEWIQPVILSPSAVTNSPTIVVDSLDRIVIAYAITLNENRGIYLIQSTDAGMTWSQPVRAFDAVAADWDMVDHPKLAVSSDGTLHLLFTRYKLLGGQKSVGLYYSKSSDGGVTWSDPAVMSEQAVPWSQMIASKDALHRFWQETDKNDLLTYHQISQDGGATWSSPIKLPLDTGLISEPVISVDGAGDLHLVQIVQSDVRTLQEWQWNGERWALGESRKISVPEQESVIPITSGITAKGNLYAVLQYTSQQGEDSQYSLLNINRSLTAKEVPQPLLVSIPTPALSSLAAATPEAQATATSVSPLANLPDSQSPINRNVIGLALIVIIVLVIVLLTVPKRNAEKRLHK